MSRFLRKFKAIAIFGSLFWSVRIAAACDLCAQYPARPIWGARDPGFIVGFGEQFTHYDTVQLDGDEVPNVPHQFMDSSITQILLGYDFTDRFALHLSVPLIYRSFQRVEEMGLHSGTESGLGDLALVGDYRLLQQQTTHSVFNLNIQGGIKFPTGSTSRLKEETQEHESAPGEPISAIHGHDLTLGSGSYDGIVGMSAYWRWKRLFAAATVQYAIRSQGDYDYRFANDLTWWGGPGVFAILTDTHTLALQFNISGETKGRDEFDGTTAADTGVTTVYLGPQISATWRNKLSAVLGVGFPVLRDNTAFQIVPDYRIQASLSWQF